MSQKNIAIRIDVNFNLLILLTARVVLYEKNGFCLNYYSSNYFLVNFIIYLCAVLYLRHAIRYGKVRRAINRLDC